MAECAVNKLGGNEAVTMLARESVRLSWLYTKLPAWLEVGEAHQGRMSSD